MPGVENNYREFLEYKFKVIEDKIKDLSEDVRENKVIANEAHVEVMSDLKDVCKKVRELEIKVTKTATVVSIIVSCFIVFGKTFLTFLGFRIG